MENEEVENKKRHVSATPSVRDFELTFSAKGLKPLFQEIVINKYMPSNSILYYKENNDNLLLSYISKKTIKDMNQHGGEIFAKESIPEINKLKELIEDAKKQNLLIDEKSPLTISKAEGIFTILEAILASYALFDNGYLDGIFEMSKSNDQAMKNLDIIEKFKNDFREEFNVVFFDSSGLFKTFLIKIATQINIDVKNLDWYLKEEILDLFNGKIINKEILNKRKIAYVFFKYNDHHHFFEGDVAKTFIDKFEDQKEVNKEIQVIKGISTNNTRKKIRGKVTIISADYSDFNKLNEQISNMENNSILVSQTTAPELMLACKKASAIITDIGGMLSHAAVVSRELNIPCIVNTQHATTILKTGDEIEVDAENGIITIIDKE